MVQMSWCTYGERVNGIPGSEPRSGIARMHAMRMRYGGAIRGCAAPWLCAYLVPFYDVLSGVPCMHGCVLI